MSKRAHKRALKGRDQRRSEFDTMSIERKKGRIRPGSLNRKKTAVSRGRR